MRRDQLEHAIAVASRTFGQKHVLVIGSQAILASHAFDSLPSRTTLSVEADIAPFKDTANEMLATMLSAAAGELSEFADVNGFHIDGVSLRTAYFPDG